VQHAPQARDSKKEIAHGGLVLATRDWTLFLKINMEVQWRVNYISRCLILAVGQAAVFDAMTYVGDWCSSFLLLLHTKHYYILYLVTTEGRGEKVGCVAASAMHRVPVLFLPCS